jgi:hypothetical protein
VRIVLCQCERSIRCGAKCEKCSSPPGKCSDHSEGEWTQQLASGRVTGTPSSLSC